MNLYSLFFELIRVSVGTQAKLSRIPSRIEWQELYKMAKKQSVIGICFAGLQKLRADSDLGFSKINISKALYFDWMGNAFTIQQKNEMVNRDCREMLIFS